MLTSRYFLLFLYLYTYVNCEPDEEFASTTSITENTNEDYEKESLRPTEATISDKSSNGNSGEVTASTDTDLRANDSELEVNTDLASPVESSSSSDSISEQTDFTPQLEESSSSTGQDAYESTTTPRMVEELTGTVTETIAKIENETTTFQIPTESKKEPFYHKTIQHLVKVVESNVLEESTLEPMVTKLSETPTDTNATEPRLDSLSTQIRAIIDHYQAYGEVTIPNADIPDPMDVPNVHKKFGGLPTSFTNMKMYGLSNFSILHINTDLNKMQVYVLVLMKRLEIIGNYSTKSWLARAAGPFNVTLFDVETGGSAELKKSEDGTLQATDSQLDMSFRDAEVDFKNLGLVGSILQSVLATAAPVLFEAIKPVVLKEINHGIRENLNGKLKIIGNRIKMSGSRPPLEAAEEEGRIYIKENGYDPYHIKNFSIRQNVFAINITEFVLEGLSNFHRVGEVVLSMDEGTIQIGSHVAAIDLNGRCKWGIGIGKSFKREGYTNFTVDHLQVRAFVNQSLDVSTKPILDKLDINLGKVRVKMEGAGRFDIVVEVMVNSLPDIIRHIIVDAIEEPLKYKIQQILNRIEPKVVLEKGLPELDNLGL